MNELSYRVSGMTCGHCVAAVTQEVSQLDGVEHVEVDLDTKLVVVRGAAADERVRAAIEDAGYDSEPVHA